MKRYKKEVLHRLMQDGLCEMNSSVTRSGLVEVRWLCCDRVTWCQLED